MMGKSSHPPTAKVHLKWLGISAGTNRRYKAAVKRFFEFVSVRFVKKPASLRSCVSQPANSSTLCIRTTGHSIGRATFLRG